MYIYVYVCICMYMYVYEHMSRHGKFLSLILFLTRVIGVYHPSHDVYILYVSCTYMYVLCMYPNVSARICTYIGKYVVQVTERSLCFSVSGLHS